MEVFGKKRKVDRECRVFQEKWTDDYFFVMLGNPVCLICSETISVVKKYNLERHYHSRHPDYEIVQGDLRKDKIRALKARFGLVDDDQLLQKMAASATGDGSYIQEGLEPASGCHKQNEDLLRASFVVSERIAKHARPYSEGEFVKECLSATINVLGRDELDRSDFDELSLSSWTVRRRIDKMAADIKLSLRELASQFEAFSIVLDESADVNDTTHLAVFVRGVDTEFNCMEEMLELRPLKDTATAEDVYHELELTFDKFGLKWDKLSGVLTDGNPTMVEPDAGVVGRIRSELSKRDGEADDLCLLQGIFHEQGLCSKSIRFTHVMTTVVFCINFLKSATLNQRQLLEFLEDVQSEDDLAFYCDVHWLSSGEVLARFYNFKNDVSNFMAAKGKRLHELDDDNWLCDLAFLADVTTHLNNLNVRLRARGQLVHEFYGHVKSFQNKLRLWESQLREGNVHHFPTLANHDKFNREAFADELRSLSDEFGARFRDVRSQETRFRVFSSPFDVDVDQAPQHLQMELIELQENSDLKKKFKNLSVTDFYRNFLTDDRFPKLTAFARRQISLFGSTHTVKHFFSRMKTIKARTMTRIEDEHLENTLRVATSSISPNIDRLVKDVQWPN